MNNRILKAYRMKIILLTSFFIASFLYAQAQAQTQSTLLSGMDKMEWEKIMPGVWKARFGETGLNALDYANPPKTEAIKELGDTPFPFSKDETLSLLTSSRASIRLPLDEAESIYGLGLEFTGINRRGNVYTLKVDHYDLQLTKIYAIRYYMTNYYAIRYC